MFTEEQMERYSRHILLKEVGGPGQQRLLDGKVLIVGAGGLGSPSALYLAAAGVGTIGLADPDLVELSNLQRQILHATPDVGRPKVESAAEKIRAINPDVSIRIYPEAVTAANIAELFADYDFVIDGTDNLAAKFLINDAAIFTGTPFSHGGILHFVGQTFTVLPGRSTCYRCIFPEPPPREAIPSCAEAGVLGVLPAVIGSLQATEALKFLLGTGELLTDRMLIFDALDMTFRSPEFGRNRECPICGTTPSIFGLRDEWEALPVCGIKSIKLMEKVDKIS